MTQDLDCGPIIYNLAAINDFTAHSDRLITVWTDDRNDIGSHILTIEASL